MLFLLAFKDLSCVYMCEKEGMCAWVVCMSRGAVGSPEESSSSLLEDAQP